MASDIQLKNVATVYLTLNKEIWISLFNFFVAIKF